MNPSAPSKSEPGFAIHRTTRFLALVLAFSACTHSTKMDQPSSITESRAAQIAIDAALQRGWTGPFKTYVTKSTEPNADKWGEVFISYNYRAAIITLDRNGQVANFRIFRE